MVRAGFTACKLDPFAHTEHRYGVDLSTNLSLTPSQEQLAIDRLKAVAEEMGPEGSIAVETHAMLNGPTAIEIAHRIEATGIHCMWYEEPAGPEFPDAIADIRSKISLPVCVGERLHSRVMFRPILERQAAGIVMPDVAPAAASAKCGKSPPCARPITFPWHRTIRTGRFRPLLLPM